MDGYSLTRDLASYYDQEASSRDTWKRDDHLVAGRRDLCARMRVERRTRLLEIGCGTGRDAREFLASGIPTVTGVDLSSASCRIAQGHGVDALSASVLALPFAADSFDACWTISTLIHVADESWLEMCRELQRVLVDGSPVVVGVWGSGSDRDDNGVQHTDTIEPKRVFHRRSDANLRRLMDQIGTIEAFATWRYEGSMRPYQFSTVRIRTASRSA
ncbi:MAG: class I SAM-dependent methyltransferase [Ilumatobacteraceae bacterium]